MDDTNGNANSKSHIGTGEAYYGSNVAPDPFFTSNMTIASANFYPYTWGNQHQLVQQYGVPLRYPDTHDRGLSIHPNVVAGAALWTSEKEERMYDENHLYTVRKSKRSSENITLRDKESGGMSALFGAGTDINGASQRAAGRIEGSSDYNADYNRVLSEQKSNQMPIDVAKHGVSPECLGTGMDFLSRDFYVNMSGSNVTPGVKLSTEAIVAREQDEVKKERRKQSKRESAKRSKLQKQLEYEQLQAAVDGLSSEGSKLADDLRNLSEECAALLKENNSIMEELEGIYGSDAMSDLKAMQLGFTKGQSCWH